jgi:hypothetical protein
MASLFSNILDSFAEGFDDQTYPSVFYFYLLDKIKNSNTPEDLGKYLTAALCWKDGKVRQNNAGDWVIESSGQRFSVGNPKPNTLGPRHEEILKSKEFFDWTKSIVDIGYFDHSLIDVINNRFGLWRSVVIPAFLIHCIRPSIFPIIDRWVLLTYRFAHNNPSRDLSPTINDYRDYQAWWTKIVAEVYPNQIAATPQQLKKIDSSLWTIGKHLFALEKKLETVTSTSDLEESTEIVSPLAVSVSLSIDTDSDIFKRRAFELAKSMNQREAIQKTAAEYGVDLSSKPSYLKYPASHFDRWRKQGIF